MSAHQAHKAIRPLLVHAVRVIHTGTQLYKNAPPLLLYVTGPALTQPPARPHQHARSQCVPRSSLSRKGPSTERCTVAIHWPTPVPAPRQGRLMSQSDNARRRLVSVLYLLPLLHPAATFKPITRCRSHHRLSLVIILEDSTPRLPLSQSKFPSLWSTVTTPAKPPAQVIRELSISRSTPRQILKPVGVA